MARHNWDNWINPYYPDFNCRTCEASREMAKHNRNPKVRKRRKWGKNVGDPNSKVGSSKKKGE